MSDEPSLGFDMPPPQRAKDAYRVLARKYRPQTFDSLIGQDAMVRTLGNAFASKRIAHAFMLTGVRGVGKTTTARIVARALNCIGEDGKRAEPTITPCGVCGPCVAISESRHPDVFEMDAASRTGIDDIRELIDGTRYLPAEARYKVYIVDEVHMLSKNAFNGLLKTLEEPPPHVKFIFATTEVQKIPITILSRCQRFDFAHVGPGKIFEQLKSIVAREGHQADDDALKLVARRAAGSMRDSQSLLDQLLAAGEGKLTATQVHAVLGTAGDERVTELAATILRKDAKTALTLLSAWVEQGLQLGELLDQLIEYWRALMLVSCGGDDVGELPVTPSQEEAVKKQGREVSLDTILTGLDVWTATKARMRGSSHAQVLLEMAVVRLCRLDEMLSVAQLVQGVGQGTASVAAPAANAGTQRAAAVRPPEANDVAKKNGPPATSGAAHSDIGTLLTLSEETLSDVWERVKAFLVERSPILANHLKSAGLPAIFGPNSLAIPFDARYNHAHAACATESNVLKVQDALRRLTGQPAIVKFEIRAGASPVGGGANGTAQQPRKRDLMQLPIFKKAGEVLGAQIYGADDDFNPVASLPSKQVAPATDDEIPPDAPTDSEEP